MTIQAKGYTTTEAEARKLLMERIEKGEHPAMFLSTGIHGEILAYNAYVTPERCTRISPKLYSEIFALCNPATEAPEKGEMPTITRETGDLEYKIVKDENGYFVSGVVANHDERKLQTYRVYFGGGCICSTTTYHEGIAMLRKRLGGQSERPDLREGGR